MESRNQLVSSKINGWSNAAKVGDNVVGGSWIDANYMICPYDNTIAWTPLEQPSGFGGIIFFSILVCGLDLALFCYQWKKLGESDTFMSGK